MKKRLISAILALAMLMSYAVIVNATETNNVALGKVFVTENGRTMSGWTNGELEASVPGGQTETSFQSGEDKDGTYAVLDLGATYDLTAIKVENLESFKGSWNYYGAKFYGTNDLEAGIAGATLLFEVPQADVVDGTVVFDQAVTGSYRYVYMEKTSSNQQMQEVSIFATQEESSVSFVDVAAPAVVSNVEAGETVTLEFTGAVNLVSLAVGSYAEAADGTQVPVSFYQVDDTTVALEPATLLANTEYTLVIDENVDDANGDKMAAVSVADISFTTGMTARVAHKDGKFIGNIATGKDIWAASGAEAANTGLKTWVDGDDSSNFVFGSTDYPSDFVVVDLGAEYAIESIGAMTQAAWNGNIIGFYLTDSVEDLTYDDLQALDSSEYSKLVRCQDNKTGNVIDYAAADNTKAARYVVMWDTTGSATPCLKEVYAYTYIEPFQVNNVALGKAFVTENGREITGWTNGELEAIEGGQSDTSFVATTADAANDGTYAVLDLGVAYELVKINTESTTTNWNYWGAKFYGTNDLEAGVAGATLLYDIPQTEVQGGTFVPEKAVSGAYRYIFMQKTSDQQQMQEVSIFAKQSVSDVEYVDSTSPAKVSNIDAGETVTLEFTGAVNLASLAVGSYAQAADGTQVPVSFYAVDATTVALDPATLKSNTAYTLVVESVEDAEGNVIDAGAIEDISFQTGVIARVAHKDGKFISSVSTNKKIWSDSQTEAANTGLKTWVDDNVDTNFVFDSTKYPNDFAVVDLGAEYTIESIGAMTQAAWNSKVIGFYLTNSIEGLTIADLQALDSSEYSKFVICQDNATGNTIDYAEAKNADAVRYIVMWDTTGNSTPCIKDLYAYAYTKPFELNNVALGKAFVTENGREITGWTNGELEAIEGGQSATSFLATTADAANDGTYAVLDLGAKYELAAIKTESTTTNWNYWGAKFYGTNDLEAGVAGATLLYDIPQTEVQGGTFVPEKEVSGAYRYIFMQKTSDQQQMQEVSIFARQKESNIFFEEVTAPATVSNIGVGETVAFKFTGAINIASLAGGIYAETAEGTKTSVSFYQVDDTTYALDPSTLTSNTAYTLVVADTVDDTEGNVVNMASVEDIEFTTGLIAKVAHKDGKFITSVSTNKLITSSNGDDLSKWIDGDAESVIGTTNETDIAIIDLGAKYEVEALQLKTQAAWTSDDLGIYLTNDKDVAVDTLTASDYATLTLKTGNTLDYADISKFADAEGYQYIVIWDTGSDGHKPTLYEVYAYAYTEPFEVNNVALGKPFVTENGRTMKGWTNGKLEDSVPGGQTDTSFVAGADKDGTYAVLDLGAKFDLTSIKVESIVNSWNYWGAKFYGTNDLEAGIAGATLLLEISQTAVQAGTLVFEQAVSGSYRYIYMEKTSSNQQMQEVSVFATQTYSLQEATFDFKDMQDAVTNVDTEDRITVSFPEGTDMSSVNNLTVYAVAQADKGSVIAAGDIHSVAVENIGNNTVAIDVAGLESYVEYKLVVCVLNAAGEFINSEAAFTTAAVANIPYNSDAMITNVAKGKTIKSAKGVAETKGLATWVDANPNTKFSFIANEYPEDYAYIDLGAEYAITQIGIQTDGVAHGSEYAGVILAKNMDDVTYESLTEAQRFARASAKTVYDGMIDIVSTDATDKYRYVILKNMNAASNPNFVLKDVYVFVQDLTSDVTITANIPVTADGVITNVGRNDVITVDFVGDVDMSTVVEGTVYAVAQSAKSGAVAVGDKKALTFTKTGDKQITIDTESLDGLMTYKILVDGARDTAGKTVRSSSAEFTTGIIANVDVAEGKVLTNVAKGKTMIPVNVEEAKLAEYETTLDIETGHLEQWLDENPETAYNVAFASQARHFFDYAVIDLGKQYKIESVGALWQGPIWASEDTAVYLTNDLNEAKSTPASGYAEFVKANAKQGVRSMLDYADVSAFDNAEGYRYVVIYNPNADKASTSISAQDFFVFAYETENDFYFSKNIVIDERPVEGGEEGEEEDYVKEKVVKANVKNAGTGTLVIAEYEGSGKLLNVKSAALVDGNAEVKLDYVATSTYKAFVWNAMSGTNGLTPVLPSIVNDIQ